MTSTVTFPAISTRPNSMIEVKPAIGMTTNFTNLSMVSLHATSMEVCHSVYGDDPVSLDTIDRYYEPSANRPSYANPFLTATSRSVISDMYQLSRQLSAIDVPGPLAMLYTLFRLRPPNAGQHDPLFQALRLWSDMGDICESESFDGHRKTIIEHTLNILLLPGIHCDGSIPPTETQADSRVSTNSSIHRPPYPTSLPIPGTSLSLPSPFHFRLHIITRLSFNEQGRITYHRDFWDVKDLMGLVPGASLAQWIATRLTARGLSYAARLMSKAYSQFQAEHVAEHSVPKLDFDDLENGQGNLSATPSVLHPSAKNALGLEGF